MTESNGLSAADVMALTKDNDCMNGMAGMWNNPFVYLIWLAFFGGGFGGWGGNNTAMQGALTRSDLCQEFNFNNLNNNIRAVERGLSDLGYANQSGQFNLSSQLAENRFAQQQCCCETNRNIDAVRAENYKNTCEITNAVHAEGEATRALMTQNTIQDLRDRLEAKDRENMVLNLFAAQQAQTQNLIGTLRPFPTPAYITCSPYTSDCKCNTTTATA